LACLHPAPTLPHTTPACLFTTPDREEDFGASSEARSHYRADQSTLPCKIKTISGFLYLPPYSTCPCHEHRWEAHSVFLLPLRPTGHALLDITTIGLRLLCFSLLRPSTRVTLPITAYPHAPTLPISHLARHKATWHGRASSSSKAAASRVRSRITGTRSFAGYEEDSGTTHGRSAIPHYFFGGLLARHQAAAAIDCARAARDRGAARFVPLAWHRATSFYLLVLCPLDDRSIHCTTGRPAPVHTHLTPPHHTTPPPHPCCGDRNVHCIP